MSQFRSQDFLLLLAYGLPLACDPSTDTVDGTASAGNADGGRSEADVAVDACGPFATKQTECSAESEDGYGYGYLSMLGYCVATLGYADYVGPACRGAIEDHYACLAELACSELGDIWGGDGASDTSDGGAPPHPCAMQEDAANAACEFGDDSEEESESESESESDTTGG